MKKLSIFLICVVTFFMSSCDKEDKYTAHESQSLKEDLEDIRSQKIMLYSDMVQFYLSMVNDTLACDAAILVKETTALLKNEKVGDLSTIKLKKQKIKEKMNLLSKQMEELRKGISYYGDTSVRALLNTGLLLKADHALIE